ncbi:MAG: hypothetical protein J7K04_16825 [Spirochaetales bacterium]|nr:hypothetical protein [Spirochaetales bacterium]
MKYIRIFILILILTAAGYPAFSFPLQSALPDASWMELTVGFGLNPFGINFRPFLKGFEFNAYFQNHAGLGFGFISRGEWFYFFLNSIYLTNPADNNFIVFPVKARFGGLNYYGDYILCTSFSSGIKGFIPVLQDKYGEPMYADADILATCFIYFNRPDKKLFEFFMEGSAGFLGEISKQQGSF